MGKKWEAVEFKDIRVGDVIRRTVPLSYGSTRTTTGTVKHYGYEAYRTQGGYALAWKTETNGAVVERRVQKVKKVPLPVEPGTVLDAVVERSWRVDGSRIERRSIRLIRGRVHWVGMEHHTGWQFIANDEDIKKWTLVAAPKA